MISGFGSNPKGGGGGGIVLDPNALVFASPTGNNLLTNPDFLGGALDAFQRPCIRDFRLGPTSRGAVHKLGAWGVDGDPQNVISEGFVTYGANSLGNGPDGSQGGLGFYTPNSFGTLTCIPGVNGGNPFYSCGFEDGGPMAPFGDPGLNLRNDFAVLVFHVDRASGTVQHRGPVLPFKSGDTSVGSYAVRTGLHCAFKANFGNAWLVGTIPPGVEGDVSYVIDGRKVGEGPGLGTGVPVYFSHGFWRVYSTDLPVQA